MFVEVIALRFLLASFSSLVIHWCVPGIHTDVQPTAFSDWSGTMKMWLEILNNHSPNICIYLSFHLISEFWLSHNDDSSSVWSINLDNYETSADKRYEFNRICLTLPSFSAFNYWVFSNLYWSFLYFHGRWPVIVDGNIQRWTCCDFQKCGFCTVLSRYLRCCVC